MSQNLLNLEASALSNVDRLCCFWARTDATSYSDVKRLLQRIPSQGSSEFQPVSASKLLVGEAVLAKCKIQSEGLSWYRAVVNDIDQQNSCRVFLMDIGSNVTASTSDLVYGPEEYFEVPPLAQKYILGDIQAKDGNFTEQEVEQLYDYLVNFDTVAEVLHEGASGLPPTLRVFMEEGSDVRVVDELLKAGCGSHYTNKHLKCHLIQRSTILPGRAHNVCMFYESHVKFWLQRVDQANQLDELQQSIQGLQAPALSPTQMCYGQACIAKFEDIEYRGVISAVDFINRSATVTFIDYGNAEDVPFNEILKLPSEFCALPSQAVECCLSGSFVNDRNVSRLIDFESCYARVLSVLESGLHIVNLGEEEKVEKAGPPPTSYANMPFNVSAYLDVCISYVKENGQFYCQMLSKAEALDELMCDLQEVSLLPLTGVMQENLCCLARSSTDGLIYRAQMLSGSPAGPSVMFVDFGVTEMVPSKSLYHLPTEFAYFPAYALCCSLHDSAAVTKESNDYLHQLLSKKPVVAKVMLKAAKFMEVALYDTEKSDEPIISTLKRNSSKQNSLQPQPTRPVQKVERSAPESQLLPAAVDPDEPINVIGTNKLGSTSFFAQLASCPVEDLEAFCESLDEYYTDNNVPCLSTCDVGSTCVALFTDAEADFEMYYRARVTDIEDDEAWIMYVDYGNIEKKLVSELKMLAPQFCYFRPAGAIFNFGEYHVAVNENALENVIVDQELTVVCEEQTEDGSFLCRMPETENNAAFLNVTRPRLDEQLSLASMLLTVPGKMRIPTRTVALVVKSNVVDPDNITLLFWEHERERDEMEGDLIQHCRDHPERIQRRCRLNEIVVVNDGIVWRRARITGVKANGTYEVHYIDHGNHTIVTANRIKELPAEFTTQPWFGIDCRLYGVEQSEEWDQSQKLETSDLFCGKPELQAYFIDKTEDKYEVEVVNIKQDRHINQKLLTTWGRVFSHFEAPEAKRPTYVCPGMRTALPPLPTPRRQEKDIPEKDVNLAKYTKIFVPYALGVERFWCQYRGDDEIALNNMLDQIAEDYARPSQPLQNPQPGMFCCALFEDDAVWYRAQIKAVTGDTANVYFVDYGNEEEVDVDSLRELKDKYYALPQQAFQCSLNNVKPIGDEWSKEANEFFVDKVQMVENLSGCPVQRNDDGSYDLELLLDEQMTKNYLIRSGYAENDSQPAKRKKGPNVLEIVKPKMLFLKADQPVTCSGIHIEGYNKFYCQLVSETEKLEEMMENIRKMYTGSHPTEQRIKKGAMCIAMYSADEEWYRAEVLNTAPGKYHVFFVDYGDEEWVDLDKVRPIHKQFMPLTMQAIHASLADITVFHSKEEKVREEMIKEMEGKTIQLIPHSHNKDGLHSVSINIDGVSLSKKLIQAGLAQPVAAAAPPPPPSRSGVRGAVQPRETRTSESSNASSIGSTKPPVTVTGMIPMNGCKYELPTLEVGSMYNVCLAWLLSPFEFYCQSTASEEVLIQLVEQLQQRYGKLRDHEMVLKDPQPGTACVAYRDTDDRWYRGSILAVRGEQAKVRFVDYGDHKIVKLSQVKAPTADLLDSPLEAVPCCLHGVDKSTSEWPEDVTVLFNNLSEQKFMLKVMAREDYGYSVDAITDDIRSASEAVLGMLLAQKRKGAGSFAAAVVDKGGAGSRSNVYNDRGDNQRSRQTVDRPAAGRSAYGAQPEGGDNTEAPWGQGKTQTRREEPYTAPPTRRNDRDAPRQQQQQQHHQAAVPAVQRFQYPEIRVESSPVDCYISSITNLQEFYLQQVSAVDEITAFATNVSSEYAALLPDERPVSADVQVNDACAALYNDDGQWYRARIRQQQGPEYSVVFVDYGNYGTVDRSSLKSLPKQLAGVPAYALHSRMRGMESYTAEDVDKLQELTDAGFPFKVEFHTRSAPFEVSLFQGDVNVLDLLPSWGLQPPKPDGYDGYKDGAPSPLEPPSGPPSGPPAGPSSESPSGSPESGYQKQTTAIGGPAYVSHIESPSEFYLQYTTDEKSLATMEEICNTNSEPLSSVSVGSPCLALFSVDGMWYRAQVVSVQGARVVVQYVDHGNYDEVDVAALRKVPTLSPPLAYKCKLHAEPRGPREWTVEEIARFSELVLERPFNVDLSGVYTPYTALLQDAETQLVINNVDEFLFAPGEKKYGKPQKELSEQPTVESPEAPGILKSLKVKQGVNVEVCYTETPSSFYVHCETFISKLEAVIQGVEEYQTEETNKVASEPEVGRMYCAKYSGDELFYRVRIEDISEDGAVTVHHVDFGSSDVTSLSEIYELRTSDCSDLALPAVAVHCSLAELEEPEGGWSDEIADRFKELINEHEATVDFMEVGKICKVSLFKDGKNIVDTLKEEFPQLQGPSEEAEATEQTSPAETEAAAPQVEDMQSATEEPTTECALSTVVEVSNASQDVVDAAVLEEEVSGDIEEEKTTVCSLAKFTRPEEALEVYISHVESPGEFYAQAAAVNDDLNVLGEKMNDYGETAAPLSLEQVVRGQVCCSKSEDNWYRAVITSVNGNNTVTVKYVDYGNSEEQQRGDVKELLPEELLAPPMYAMECTLAGVETLDWHGEEDKFTEATQDVELTMEIINSQEEPYEVVLKDEAGDIAQRLFPGTVTPSAASKVEDDATASNYSTADSSPRQDAAAAEASVPQESSEANDAPDGDCEQAEDDASADPSRLAEVHPAVVEEEQAEEDGCLPGPIKLECGETIPVAVALVESPSKFYIQLKSTENDLTALKERLHSFYSQQTEEEIELPDPLQEGVICAAKYSECEDGSNEKWYRARVQNVSDDESDEVTVFFIDYGNSETVSSSSLRVLGEDYLQLPAQSIPCCLSNVQPITDEWPDEAITSFTVMVLGNEHLTCKPLLYADSQHEVDLFEDGNSIADLLKKEGSAIEITETEENGVEFVTQIETADTLERDAELSVSITYHQSQDDFWVQKKPCPDHLAEMKAFYDSSCPEAVATDIQQGRCYIVKNKNSWDRVEVTAIEDENVSVFYVDIGKEATVEKEYIYPLAARFNMPAQCYPCRLVGVKPKEGEEWSDKAIDMMKELTAEKCLVMTVIENGDESTKKWKYGVQLLDMGVPVSKVLVENDLAELVEIKATSKQDKQDTTLLSESVQEYVDEILTSARQCLEEELINVVYLHGDNPHQFFVQLADGEEELNKLELDAKYEAAEKVQEGAGIKENDNVLVSDKNKCYRATVVSVGETDAEVEFIDYGGRTVTVMLDSVRVLEPSVSEEVFQLPSQSMACRLEGIESAEWTEDVMDYMEGLVCNKPLTMRILSQDEADVCSVYLELAAAVTKADEEEGDDSVDRELEQKAGRAAAGGSSSVNITLVKQGYATVVPGCQLDIDLDLETQDASVLESSFLEIAETHSNSIGDLNDSTVHTEEEGTTEPQEKEEEEDKQKVEYASSIPERTDIASLSSVSVLITSWESAMKFWCKLVSDEATLLDEQMQQSYNASPSEHCIPANVTLEEGSACAALFPANEDDKDNGDAVRLDSAAASPPSSPQWCRAEVYSMCGDVYTVRCCDTGLLATVARDSLRQLLPSLAAIPRLAVKCQLIDLQPPEGAGDWSASPLLEQYRSAVQKMTVLHVPESKDDDEPAAVHVLLRSEDCSQGIREELIKQKLAKPMDADDE